MVEAVGGAAPVLVDGGVRSGLDVLAALALGADAVLVLVGRPALHALAAEGPQGVTDLLTRLHHELANAMALVGAGTPAEVTADLVVR